MERERGITVRAHTTSLVWRHTDGLLYLLNLIDTPVRHMSPNRVRAIYIYIYSVHFNQCDYSDVFFLGTRGFYLRGLSFSVCVSRCCVACWRNSGYTSSNGMAHSWDVIILGNLQLFETIKCRKSNHMFAKYRWPTFFWRLSLVLNWYLWWTKLISQHQVGCK